MTTHHTAQTLAERAAERLSSACASRAELPPMDEQAQIILCETNLQALVDALRDIAEHPHCIYDNNESGQYGIGVTDGHRCAATIAQQALKRLEGE